MRTKPLAVASGLALVFGCVVVSQLVRAQAQVGRQAQGQGQASGQGQGQTEGQGGDQVLDGISETDLIARYVLDNNTNDRSRNTFNATVKGERATFVDDTQFGRALSLAADKETYLELPQEALKDAESLSVSAWVN